MKYKIALGQISSGKDVDKNLNKIETMVKEAAANGASLIVFPEHAEYMGGDFGKNAHPVSGEVSGAFAAMAKENNVYIHCGSITESRGEKLPYNTSLLFSSTGSLIAKYSKLHMFDIRIDNGPSYMESKKSGAGDEIAVADTRLGKFGLAICYDIRFPEMFRVMAKAGAEVFLIPANFTESTGRDHWLPLLQARAIENTCFVAAADQTGSTSSFESHGTSVVIDPWGKVLAKGGKDEEIIYAEIDISLIDETRRQMPSLQNTREDVYTSMSEKIHIYYDTI